MSTLDICDRVMVILDGRLVGVRHASAAGAGQPVLPLAPSRRSPPARAGGRARCLEPARRGSPTSSSSGTPRAARPRCTRCSARHPQIFMPELQGAVVLRRRAARAHAAAPGRHAAHARGVPRAVRAARRRSSASARRRRCTCGRARAARADRARCSRTRGSSRSCASRRASCARCTCSSLQTHVETEHDLAQGARAGADAARGTQHPAPHLLAAGAALLRPRPLRRAAAPLPRACSRASRCWC